MVSNITSNPLRGHSSLNQEASSLPQARITEHKWQKCVKRRLDAAYGKRRLNNWNRRRKSGLDNVFLK